MLIQEEYQHPEYLVETEWLEQHLGSDNLKIFDCTVDVEPNPDSEQSNKVPFIFKSGHNDFKNSHIPGAGFIDILNELSDLQSSLPLMMTSRKKIIEMMRIYGINDDSQVVLYSSTEANWATRVWWILRTFGFNNAAILNGGFSKWKSERRFISSKPCGYETGNFSLRSNPDLFVSKADVLSAIGKGEISIINALPSPIHVGTSDFVFGRKGRISDSVNVPFSDLHNPDTGCYLPARELQKLFENVDVDNAEHIITYCGAGVAASNDAFALTLLGYENVSVYDGSMFEWGNDASLPMEMG